MNLNQMITPVSSPEVSRRHFFAQSGINLGKIALGTLLARSSSICNAGSSDLANPLAPKNGHHPAKTKSVIYLFMAGAPSQLDLLDYKPVLEKFHNTSPPKELVEKLRLAFAQGNAKLLAPQYKFKKCGKSGTEISEILPHLQGISDDIAVVRSVHAEHFNHAPAQIFFNTGSPMPGRPSMGSWVSYGLGSEADDLPSYVVLSSGGGTSGGNANFNSGFLPTLYSGVPFRSTGSPIVNVENPAGIDQKLQRDSLDLIRQMNEKQLAEKGDPEISARISAYEMAFRMQVRAPELMDFSQESKETLEMYGIKDGEFRVCWSMSSCKKTCRTRRTLCQYLPERMGSPFQCQRGIKKHVWKFGSACSSVGQRSETTWFA